MQGKRLRIFCAFVRGRIPQSRHSPCQPPLGKGANIVCGAELRPSQHTRPRKKIFPPPLTANRTYDILTVLTLLIH